MTQKDDVTVQFTLRIEALWTDSGDYMRNATMPEFMKWAQDNGRHLSVFIKEGACEPKQIPAKIVVESVVVKPRP